MRVVNQPETDTDLVVAGAGAAGLAAAMAAAERGANVALLEASATFRTGSNTSMSTSMVPVGGSRWQRAFGIDDDSPDHLYEDIMAKSKGQADPIVARALVDVGNELAEWLADDCRVVVGGLVLSTVFTLFLVPALFSLAMDARAYLAERAVQVLKPAQHTSD